MPVMMGRMMDRKNKVGQRIKIQLDISHVRLYSIFFNIHTISFIEKLSSHSTEKSNL